MSDIIWWDATGKVVKVASIGKLVKRAGAMLTVSIVLFAVWFTKPWDDLQSWRWYTMPFAESRAELFTHWEVIQPQGKLSASSKPRAYVRTLSPVATIDYEFDGTRVPLEEYLAKANISGLMVLHNGIIRLEFYDKGLDADSRNHIWSATKSFTSTLVGMALLEGRISSLNDLVEVYAPQFSGTPYGVTPIKHVMMMSSGMDFFHFEGSPNRNDMYWDIMQAGHDFDAWAAALPRRVPSGTDFNYIATDTHVLSAVLRGAYARPFTEIVQELLWERGGFAGDAQWGLDASGHAMGHCCLSLRLLEFAHLGQLYVEDLVMAGTPTVAADWFDLVENAQAPFQEPGYDEQGNARRGYSVQFWLPNDYEQEFIAAGAFGQYLWIDRKRGAVVAQFSTGQPMLLTRGESGASPEEFAAVMRTLTNPATFE